MHHQKHEDKDSELCMSTRTTVIFRAVVTDVFDLFACPERSGLQIECLHDEECEDVEHDAHSHHYAFKLPLEESEPEDDQGDD